MKLTFLGATHEVTGSCYLLEACGKKILIDCGLEQGGDTYENKPIPYPAGEIDMVLLTHAHMDHSGLLPLLCKQGFSGQIFATGGTTALCRIMLMDSAHIQEFEAEWKNRKNERAGRPLVEPIYTEEDAQTAIRCFVSMDYDERKYIADGIEARFFDAGHLLGSSSIELTITEKSDEAGNAFEGIVPSSAAGYVTRRIVFSGDIGNTNQPLIDDPHYPDTADYVVMESTYGDRSHEKPADYATALAEVIQRTFDRGGNVVIPSFAVGRTQEMLYFIRKIKQDRMVHGHDGFKVYVDSPLANEATNIFLERMYDDFDEEAKDLLNQGINPIGFDGLKTSVTSEDSKAINFIQEPKVIISASGMCDAGRIKHHLKHNLWRKESTILFVGYQAEGTLGRSLIEGKKNVKVFGEDIEVHAEILQLPGVSGHADNNGLMRWAASIKNKPQKIFVTHGEDKVTELFRDRLINELHVDAYAPFSGTEFDLVTGQFLLEAEPVPIEKQVRTEIQKSRERGDEVVQERSGRNKKSARVYSALLAAGERLLAVIKKNAGGANKDLRRFTEEINRLAEKYDR